MLDTLLHNYTLRLVMLVVAFLVIGKPIARYAAKKSNGNATYYYALSFCVIVAMLCLLSLSGCSGNTEPRVPEISMPFDTAYWKDMQGNGAITYCDRSDNPFIFYNGILAEPVSKTVHTHEWKHIEQIHQAKKTGLYGFKGGCKAFMEMNKDTTAFAREFRFQMEAHAYCAQIEELPDDIDKLAGRIQAIHALENKTYDLRMTEAYIREHLPC